MRSAADERLTARQRRRDPSVRLERFSEDVQNVIQQAQKLMQEQHHTQLEVEHILLVLLQESDGVATHALDVLGVDPTVVLRRVESELQQRPRVYSALTPKHTIYVAPSTVRLLKRAEQEANHARDGLVHTTHLLRVISDDLDSASGRVLLEHEVTGDRIAAALASLPPEADATRMQPQSTQSQGNRLEERVAVLEDAMEMLRQAMPQPQSEQDGLTQAQHHITALELEIQHLREVLRLTQESLTYTRALLDHELASRYGEPQFPEKGTKRRA